MTSNKDPKPVGKRTKKKKKKEIKPFKGNSIPNGMLLLLLISILCIFGLYMVYSASYVGVVSASGELTSPWYYLVRQLRGIVLGVVLGYIFFRLPSMNIKAQRFIIGGFFVLSFLLLIYAYAFGDPINGSTRWIQLSFINIQPSELLKIALVLVVAFLLSKMKKHIVIFFLLSLIIPAMVAIENLSSGLLMVAAVFVMFAVYGLKKSQIITFTSIIGIFGVLFIFLEPYRLSRITNYLTMLVNPLKADYQTKESLYALANGGIAGKGITYSTQKFFYLPEHHTDFIFAIVGEELGFLGEIVLIGLFFLMIYLIYQIAIQTKTLFMKYACLGFGTLFAVQIVLNIGVVSGLLPVTGVTSPFLSYGGSSLMTSLMMIGFILGCSELKKERKNKWVRKRAII